VVFPTGRASFYSLILIYCLGARFNGTWKAPRIHRIISSMVTAMWTLETTATLSATHLLVNGITIICSAVTAITIDCQNPNTINIYGFGCDGGYINFVNGLYSGGLARKYVNPYPTADLYTDDFYQNNRQHMGIVGNNATSCDNACCGWWSSGYMWYNCYS
jgi:hypothetical protein